MSSPALPHTIAFIGTGVMGGSMAAQLQRAGHSLQIYNRSRAKAAPLLAAGARWHDSAGAAAAAAEVVITMLGFPQDVEACYLDPAGIIARARPGALLIDMTTSRPVLAQTIAAAAAARGLDALDAPVSGGDVGAKEGKLVIMVGGSEPAFARALPLFACMGKTIARLGGAGAGQHAKMANQIAVAVGMVAWVEALAYARRAGLDPVQVQSTISGGAAGSWGLTTLGPRALSGNYAPGFYVKHIVKDLGIALDAAAEMELALPGLALAHDLYTRVASRGWDECGTQVLYRLYTES